MIGAKSLRKKKQKVKTVDSKEKISKSGLKEIRELNINDDTWSCNVYLLMESNVDSTQYVKMFDLVAETRKRSAVIKINKQDVLNIANDSRKETSENETGIHALKEKVKEMLQSGEDIPTDILAKLIKIYILNIRSYYIEGKEFEATIKETSHSRLFTPPDKLKSLKLFNVTKMIRAYTKSLEETIPKYRSKAPPIDLKAIKHRPELLEVQTEDKHTTKLKKRGSEWKEDNKDIKDEPLDGPHAYIILLGFYESDIVEKLLTQGIALLAIIKVEYEEPCVNSVSSFIDESDEKIAENNTSKINEFWKNVDKSYLNRKDAGIFKDIAVISVSVPPIAALCKKSNLPQVIYDQISFCMYDVELDHRLHKHYLNSMKIIPLEETVNPLILEDMTVYNNLMDEIPAQELTIPFIVHCIIEQVDKMCSHDVSTNGTASTTTLFPLNRKQSSKYDTLRNSVSSIDLSLRKSSSNNVLGINNGSVSEYLQIQNKMKVALAIDELDSKYHLMITEKVQNYVEKSHTTLHKIVLENEFLSSIYFSKLNLERILFSMLKSFVYGIFCKFGDQNTLHKLKYNFHLNHLLKCLQNEDVGIRVLCDYLHLLYLQELRCTPENCDTTTMINSLSPNFMKSYFPTQAEYTTLRYERRWTEPTLTSQAFKIKMARKSDLQMPYSTYLRENFECPEIICLLDHNTYSYTENKNITGAKYIFKEKLFSIKILWEIFSSFLTFSCMKHSYFSPTDALVINFHNHFNEDGIETKTHFIFLRSDVSFKDFCDYIIQEDKEWFESEEMKYLKNLKEQMDKSAETNIVSLFDTELTTETFEVETFLLYGSVKYNIRYEIKNHADVASVHETPGKLSERKQKSKTPSTKPDKKDKSEKDSEKSKKMGKQEKTNVGKSKTKERDKDHELEKHVEKNAPKEVKHGSQKQTFATTESQYPKKKYFEGYNLGPLHIQNKGRITRFLSMDGSSVKVTDSKFLYEKAELCVEINKLENTVFFSAKNSFSDNTFIFHVITKNNIIMAFSIDRNRENILAYENDNFKTDRLGKNDFQNSNNIEFHMTWPNGLKIEVVKRLNETYIKQKFLTNSSTIHDEERYRCFLRNGKILKFLKDGTVKILFADGTIIHCTGFTKSEKSAEQQEQMKSKTTLISQTEEQKVDKMIKNKKHSSKNRKMKKSPKTPASVSSKQSVLSDITILDPILEHESTDSISLTITECFIITPRGEQVLYSNSSYSRVNEDIFWTSSENIIGCKKLITRIDGLKLLFESDSSLIVLYPDGTRITSLINVSDLEDEDLENETTNVSESFLCVSRSFFMEHPAYGSVYVDESEKIIQVMCPGDVTVKLDAEKYKIQIDKRTEITVRNEHLLFFSNPCEQCSAVSNTVVNFRQKCESKFEDIFCTTTDSWNNMFNVGFDGKCWLEKTSHNLKTKAPCSPRLKRHISRKFVLESNYSGTEFIHEDDVIYYLRHLSKDDKVKINKGKRNEFINIYNIFQRAFDNSTYEWTMKYKKELIFEEDIPSTYLKGKHNDSLLCPFRQISKLQVNESFEVPFMLKVRILQKILKSDETLDAVIQPALKCYWDTMHRVFNKYMTKRFPLLSSYEDDKLLRSTLFNKDIIYGIGQTIFKAPESKVKSLAPGVNLSIDKDKRKKIERELENNYLKRIKYLDKILNNKIPLYFHTPNGEAIITLLGLIRVIDHTNQVTRRHPRYYNGADNYYSGLHGDYNNYIVRHPVGHHYFQSSSSNDQNNDIAHVAGVIKTPGRRITTGLFRTSQRGSVKIPYMGASVRVPAMTGSRKAYRGTITTTILTRQEAEARNNHRNNSHYPIHDEPAHNVCVKCPKDKTVVASRGFNYVLMERPKVRHCHNRHRVPGAKFEHIYGPQKGMPVFEGSNVILGRITYKHKVLQHCRYNYNVIVRKCPPLMPPKHVKVECSAGSTWGSECQLSCTTGYQIHGHNTTECNDKLKWVNPLPHCTVITGCLLPMSPMHGQLKCHTSDSGESGEMLPQGSVCHYACDEGYSVPRHQQHLLVIQCNAGEWNSTADPSCHRNFALNDDDRLQPQVFSSDTVHHVVRMRHRRHKRDLQFSELHSPCEPNPCHGNGTCTVDPHHKQAVCTCVPGRIGVYCETKLCGEDTCKNGGICVDTKRPNCICPVEYGGVYCESKLCGYSICKNGGKCVDSNGPQCECTVGYIGIYCEIQDLG